MHRPGTTAVAIEGNEAAARVVDARSEVIAISFLAAIDPAAFEGAHYLRGLASYRVTRCSDELRR